MYGCQWGKNDTGNHLFLDLRTWTHYDSYLGNQGITGSYLGNQGITGSYLGNQGITGSTYLGNQDTSVSSSREQGNQEIF